MAKLEELIPGTVCYHVAIKRRGKIGFSSIIAVPYRIYVHSVEDEFVIASVEDSKVRRKYAVSEYHYWSLKKPCLAMTPDGRKRLVREAEYVRAVRRGIVREFFDHLLIPYQDLRDGSKESSK